MAWNVQTAKNDSDRIRPEQRNVENPNEKPLRCAGRTDSYATMVHACQISRVRSKLTWLHTPKLHIWHWCVKNHCSMKSSVMQRPGIGLLEYPLHVRPSASTLGVGCKRKPYTVHKDCLFLQETPWSMHRDRCIHSEHGR